MSIGNTFKQFLRPGAVENEEARKEEQMPNQLEFSKEEPMFSPEQTYQAPTYDYLDSEVFTLSTSSVYYAEPRDYEDAEIITQAIEAGKIVILRLDNLKDGLDKRILDFVSGFCCAYKIMPLRTSIESQWIIDPKNKRPKTGR